MSPKSPAQPSPSDLLAQLAQAQRENELLRAAVAKAGSSRISLKVSEKGGLSVYGMGKFPITLYKEQWLKLLDMAEGIRQFIKDHDGELKAKGDAKVEKALSSAI